MFSGFSLFDKDVRLVPSPPAFLSSASFRVACFGRRVRRDSQTGLRGAFRVFRASWMFTIARLPEYESGFAIACSDELCKRLNGSRSFVRRLRLLPSILARSGARRRRSCCCLAEGGSSNYAKVRKKDFHAIARKRRSVQLDVQCKVKIKTGLSADCQSDPKVFLRARRIKGRQASPLLVTRACHKAWQASCKGQACRETWQASCKGVAERWNAKEAWVIF